MSMGIQKFGKGALTSKSQRYQCHLLLGQISLTLHLTISRVRGSSKSLDVPKLQLKLVSREYDKPESGLGSVGRCIQYSLSSVPAPPKG